MVMSFLADVGEVDGRAFVRVAGELDVLTADDMVAAGLRALERPGGGPLVVDLSELSFCDSTGLRALLKLNHEALMRGRTVLLRGVQPRVRRAIEITRFDAVLRVEADPTRV
jgi:anti-sigma B factor antagonist